MHLDSNSRVRRLAGPRPVDPGESYSCLQKMLVRPSLAVFLNGRSDAMHRPYGGT